MNQHVPEPRWYAVRAEVRNEAKAAYELSRAGFVVYYPVVRKEYRHNRTKKWLMKVLPMFNGYLFVKTIGEPDAYNIRECDGVVGLVHNMGRAVPLAAGEIEHAQHLQDTGKFDNLREHGKLKAGDRVQVSEGAASGFYGMVVSAEGRKHVKVLLNHLREVKLSVEHLEAV